MDSNTRRQKQQALMAELIERKIRLHAQHLYDQRGQAESEGEAPDITDGQDVQQQRGQERDRVGHQNGPPGPGPATLDGRPQRSALAYFIAQSLEVHDERVGGNAYRDDQSGDAR